MGIQTLHWKLYIRRGQAGTRVSAYEPSSLNTMQIHEASLHALIDGREKDTAPVYFFYVPITGRKLALNLYDWRCSGNKSECLQIIETLLFSRYTRRDGKRITIRSMNKKHL